MKNEQHEYRTLQQDDWSQDVEDIRREVLSKINAQGYAPEVSRVRYLKWTIGFAALLVVIGIWIGAGLGSISEIEKDTVGLNLRVEPTNNSTSTETHLASAEAGPINEPKIAMQILTNDPNVIILLVD